MSLQLILGSSGAGKTSYGFNKIIEDSIRKPGENYIIIVPEQNTMQTQKKIVEIHPNKGIMNVDVLSFGRLGYRVFGETGEPDEVLIDDESKNLILRKMSKKYENELKILGSNMKKIGYISEVKSILSEFSQYGIDKDELEEFAKQLPDKSLLNYKLQDLSKLYEGFNEFTAGRFMTGEQQLEYLSNKIKDSNFLKDSHILFDGFTGFTPVQYKLIEELLLVCQDMAVTITIDEENMNSPFTSKYELFSMSKETIKNLKKIAYDNFLEVKEDISITTTSNGRFAFNPELLFLEDNLFRYRGKIYTNDVKNIVIESRKNVLEETKWVANTIRKMVREENYRYRDFAIIASEPELYMGHLSRACDGLDIPLFTDNKRSVLMNSFIEHIRSLLEMREKNYTYDTVFRFLKSGLGFKTTYINNDGNTKEATIGYGIFSANAIDTIENYILKTGISGYRQWSKAWSDKEENEDNNTYVEHNRIKFIENIEDFHQILGKQNKTVQDIASAIYTYLDKNNVQKKVEARAEYFYDNKNYTMEREYSQIYGAVMELLEKLVGVLQEDGKSMRVSTREFIELFDAGLEEIRIGVIPPTVDVVLAGDLQRTRVGDVKVLFLVGANDTALPGKLTSAGILSEHDRDIFEQSGITLKPSSKEQMYLHKFYMYLNLTKPTDKILISYPSLGDNGKVTRPSYIINDLQYLYPKLKISNSNIDINNTEMTEYTGVEYLVNGYKDTEVRSNPNWIELNRWYEEKDEWVETLNLLKRAHLYVGVDDNLSQGLAGQLYGKELVNSVSRLEKYGSCPFKYFVESGLKLRERDIRESKANDLGNVIHSALEQYGKTIKENKMQWYDLSVEEQIKLADKTVEDSVKDYNNKLYEKSSRDTYIVTRMKRLMRRTVIALTNQIEGGDFTPEGFELKFGESNGLSESLSNINLDNGVTMKLRGTIDRVDLFRNNDETQVRIVDYKTGKARLDLGMMEEGLQLQLFVYLNAALKANSTDGNEAKAAGIFYYGVEDPIIDAKDATKDKLEDKIQSELKLDGLIVENSWRNMDRDAKGHSKLLPMQVKVDGTLSDNIIHAKAGELEKMCGKAMEKVSQFGNEIIGGNVKIAPHKMEKGTACDYCNYKNVCGFDCNIGEYSYREINSVTNKEVLHNIRAEINKDEEGEN